MSIPITIRVIRNFRIKHGIFLQELADAAGKSQQWVSKVELGSKPATDHIHSIVSTALHRIVQQRKQQVVLIEADYLTIKDCLLEEEIEWTHP
jgi:predicted transcriptional regulator